MIIYVIVKGEFDDKHVVTATTSKYKAEVLRKAFSDKDGVARIEEFVDRLDCQLPAWSVGVTKDKLFITHVRMYDRPLFDVDKVREITKWRYVVEVRAFNRKLAVLKARDIVTAYKRGIDNEVYVESSNS